MFTPVFNILQELDAEPSSNLKKDIVRKYKDHAEFLMTVEAALNPLTTYGIKKIPEYDVGRPVITLRNAIKKLGPLANRNVTGGKAIKHLQYLLENVEFDDALVIERIIKKSLDCGTGARLINSALGRQVIATTPYNGCAIFNAKTAEKLVYPCLIQTKMDGMFQYAFINGTSISWMSRQGVELGVSIPHLEEELIANFPSGHITSGELLAVDDDGVYLPRKIGNGIVNKIRQGKAVSDKLVKSLRYVLWEVTPREVYEGKATAAYTQTVFKQIVTQLSETNPLYITTPDYEIINAKHEADRFYAEQRALGREGAIVKSSDHVWENRRSKSQLKMKAKETADLRVVDICEGSGQFKGMLGAFMVETDDGEVKCRVGTGFTPAQREEYYSQDMVGKVVELNFNELITRKGSDIYALSLPVFSLIRDDKDETNSGDYLKSL